MPANNLIPKNRPGTAEQYAFEVDLDLCTGCKACVTACHNLNGLAEGETWRTTDTIHNIVEPPLQQTITFSCHHCLEPACLKGCPVKAYEKESDTGIVRHLDDQCIGCRYCQWRCPYGAPKFSAEMGIVRKCDMCIQRLKANEPPACVQGCTNKAIRVVIIKKEEARLRPENYAKLPGTPDPGFTLPTTRYTKKEKLPDSMELVEYYPLEKNDSHLPLVFMLIFTQMGVGVSVISSLINLFLQEKNQNIISSYHFLAATIIVLTGLLIGSLHLGRPIYGFRAFLNIKKSWLSREVVIFGLFMQVSIIWSSVLIYSLLGERTIQTVINEWSKPFSFLTALTGLIAVYCSAMIYVNTPKKSWATKATILRFYATTFIMGSIGTLLTLSLIVNKTIGEMFVDGWAIPLFAILTIITIVTLVTNGMITFFNQISPLTHT